MRFIGNKEKLLEKICEAMFKHSVFGVSIFDFFAGTTSVGKYFKSKNYQVYSSDLLYLSYVLQKAYIENNEVPNFTKLLGGINQNRIKLFGTNFEAIIDYLNNLDGVSGFIYNNYTPQGTKNLQSPRMYFTGENGKKIDAIRVQIQKWKDCNLITEMEYYILLSCLVESVGFFSNVSGVYSAFQKSWDKRALKPFNLKPIKFYSSDFENKVFNVNSMDLIDAVKADILYLDPPYNSRQYAPNYHLLETIARYDNPQIYGVTGMRNYDNQKSDFCNAKKAIKSLDFIAKRGHYKFLLLSYNSEGIMSKADILDTLAKYGKVDFEKFEYVRFKSNSKGLSKIQKSIFEYLFILRK